MIFENVSLFSPSPKLCEGKRKKNVLSRSRHCKTETNINLKDMSDDDKKEKKKKKEKKEKNIKVFSSFDGKEEEEE